MMDMHGTRERATVSSSFLTSGARYWGSCMASATSWKSAGLTWSGVAAEIRPGAWRESTSTRPS